jgi:hydrid cluster protein-associated redox disulfide domain
MEVIDMAATINKDMIIADMLKIDPGIAAILMASGMHCIGCPSAQGETLDEAAMVHGMNADELVVNVNEYLAKKEA